MTEIGAPTVAGEVPTTVNSGRATIGPDRTTKGTVMLGRLPASLTLALMGVFATTGLASAADLTEYSDQTEVMVGAGIVVLALMTLLFVIFLVKRALGIDHHANRPGDEAADPHAAHGHAEHGDSEHAETGATADETHSIAPTPTEPVGGHGHH
jgi:hypothetical protein